MGSRVYEYKGVRGMWEMYGDWGVGMAPPHGVLTNKVFVPPIMIGGLGRGRSTSRGRWEGVGSTGCYLR